MSGQESIKKGRCGKKIGGSKAAPWFERTLFCMFCGKSGEHFSENCTLEDIEYFRKSFVEVGEPGYTKATPYLSMDAGEYFRMKKQGKLMSAEPTEITIKIKIKTKTKTKPKPS